MSTYPFITVDVFTDRQFGGNPLAVFPDARGLTDIQMQALATELNLSETTFVLPPDDPTHTARVRIFNRVEEMPFAGHPNVGTGFVLASQGAHRGDALIFEELAGLVRIEIDRDVRGEPSLVTIAAPQPLSLQGELPVDVIAACINLDASDVITRVHSPLIASVGIPFVLAEVRTPALAKAAANIDRFREVVRQFPTLKGRLSVHVYSREEKHLRARMFAPLAGMMEDAATGSANATLGALLLSRSTDAAQSYVVLQGVEMGRPSLLHVAAEHVTGGYRAKVGGSCKVVFRGEAILDDSLDHPSQGGHWGIA